ncbi:MAG TPA: DUF1499 domain-containing protein [Synechococcales cyanobacterium M55_K2018_004]|nr:DUF1499 domain-containing protein [Synechococcales cyanobacterium M55_K2018_004]
MFRAGFALLLSGVLVLSLWAGKPTPVSAQSFTAFPPILMAKGKSLFSFAGTRPTNLGVKDGKLLACPSTPNCVNSQTDAADKEHAIAPLRFSSDPDQAIANLKAVIHSMERAEILNADNHYLYAEFTSPFMGFVDDVEFFLDEAAGVIHVRSASRLGASDLGVNRKRVEAIRAAFRALED